MLRIKNLTNSPYDILDGEGKKVCLPARGEIETSVHAQYRSLYQTLGYFQITELPIGDSPKGDLTKLRTDYQEIVGKRPSLKWDAAELQKRIDEALVD